MPKPNETRHNARVIERAVVAVMDTSSGPGSARQGVALRSAVPSVNELLKQSTAHLARISSQVVPEVRAHSSSQYVTTGKISEYFAEIPPQHANILRATVHGLPLSDDLPASSRPAAVSHLVGIVVTSGTRGWLPSTGICDVIVHIPPRDVVNLLHDVFIDIAMFYSWPALVRRYQTTSTAFNSQKVAFALARKLSTSYGHLDPNAGYYSFAASCHVGGEFDFEKYERLWKEFVASLLPPEEASDPGLTAFDQIFRYCRFRGELSPAKIEEIVHPLPNGVYFLARYSRPPQRGIDVTRVSQLFHVKKAKRGATAVIPQRDLYTLARYFDYLQLFKFVVKR